MVDLSLHILDIATNAFKANAKNLLVKITEEKDFIDIIISDDGCGMDKDTLEKVTNPFYTTRTTRKVGLGIPLFKQTCEQTEGFLEIDSKEGVGTVFHALVKMSHIDSIPLGDIAESIFVLIINPYDVDVRCEITSDKMNEQFVIDTKELKEVLDGVPLIEASVSAWIKEYINTNLKINNI